MFKFTKNQKKEFNLRTARFYSDVIVSRLFAKLPIGAELTNENIDDIRSLDLPNQKAKYTKDGAAVWST